MEKLISCSLSYTSPKNQFCDHSPLLIKLHGNQRQAVNRPFRFQGAWFTHSEFHKVVQLVLNKEICLLTNNASLSITLVNWDKSTFGNIYKKK